MCLCVPLCVCVCNRERARPVCVRPYIHASIDYMPGGKVVFSARALPWLKLTKTPRDSDSQHRPLSLSRAGFHRSLGSPPGSTETAGGGSASGSGQTSLLAALAAERDAAVEREAAEASAAERVAREFRGLFDNIPRVSRRRKKGIETVADRTAFLRDIGSQPHAQKATPGTEF